MAINWKISLISQYNYTSHIVYINKCFEILKLLSDY